MTIPSYALDAVAAQTAAMAVFVELDTGLGMVRFWTGDGVYTTPDTFEWTGTGRLGEISAIEQATGDDAPEVTLTLSGLDENLQAAIADVSADIKGRMATLGVMHFSADSAGALTYLGRYALFKGRMESVTSSATSYDENGVPVIKRTISIGVESLFADKRVRPSASTYSYADQKARYPTDEGLIYMQTASDRTPEWPFPIVT